MGFNICACTAFYLHTHTHTHTHKHTNVKNKNTDKIKTHSLTHTNIKHTDTSNHTQIHTHTHINTHTHTHTHIHRHTNMKDTRTAVLTCFFVLTSSSSPATPLHVSLLRSLHTLHTNNCDSQNSTLFVVQSLCCIPYSCGHHTLHTNTALVIERRSCCAVACLYKVSAWSPHSAYQYCPSHRTTLLLCSRLSL